MSNLLRLVLVCVLCGTATLGAAANLPPTPVIGQVISAGALIDGLPIPAGTTVVSRTILSTGKDSASVQLSTGQSVYLAAHSKAYVESVTEGVKIAVRAGVVRFDAVDGHTVSAPPNAIVLFSERRAGRPINQFPNGVVAVLSKQARKGDGSLLVNDTSYVDPGKPILIVSLDGETKESHNVSGLGRDSIATAEKLGNGFAEQSLVIQGESDPAGFFAFGKVLPLGAGLGSGILGGALRPDNRDEGDCECKPLSATEPD